MFRLTVLIIYWFVFGEFFQLYADFYSSDIIVASPLGLRMIVGAEGEAERDYDFLASIEVLILDQTEIFLMQVCVYFFYLICYNGWETLYEIRRVFQDF